MKRLLCLIGGVLLTAFSLLCFFEFFLAWNRVEIIELLREDNFSIDALFSYPLNSHWSITMSIPGTFTFNDMIAAFLGETNQWGNPVGFLAFTREDWLQLTVFSLISLMLVVKIFKYKSSNKGLSMAFTALAVLAAWVAVKEFVEQWQYMFNADSGERWQQYFLEDSQSSKTRVMLNMALHAIPQLLLIFTFGSMASVMKAQGKKSVFAPVFFAILHAGVSFAYNMTGLGFAVNWGMQAALIFLAVDALLMVGLLLTGIAVKEKKKF